MPEFRGPDPVIVTRLRRAGLLLAAVVAAYGLLALLGWMIGNEVLKGAYGTGISIKTNAAVALFLSGAAFLLLGPARPRGVRLWLGRALAALVTAIGLATLVQHLSGVDLGIDQLFYPEPPGESATASPNRMGPPASVNFPLLGVALLLLERRTRGGTAPAQVLALVALLIASLPILGYVYGVRDLYGIARFTGIALPTAICFALLSTAVLLARPDARPMRLLALEGEGGMVARRMLPAAIIIPVVLGWVRVVFQEQGWYDDKFGRTLLALSFIVIFSLLVWWTGSGIARLVSARAKAEEGVIALAHRLAVALESERTAREAAEHADRMKDRFLATLSHELRTPLNAIQGWARVLEHPSRSEADLDRGLEAIERNARLQARLIDDLLDMSRIISGNIRLVSRPVDLRVVVETALAGIAPAASSKGVVVESEIDPRSAAIVGDPERLQQILWNLLSNAVKFTPSGGRVRVALRREGEGALIEVADSGIGIAPDILPRIFDRFLMADDSTTRRHGGLGLGLSIARQLAELHGGSLTAASPGEGRGAIFTVRLPIQGRAGENSEGPGDALPAGAASADGAPSLEGVRILIVDDQSDARDLVERILRERHAHTESADGAASALRLLEEREFDVLVSDVAMPERDGYDLLREARKRVPSLPALALTAFAREEDRRLAIEAGYQIHLAKPVDPRSLADAVASLARPQS